MRIRALDTSGDWTFGKGQSNYFRDIDALRQLLSCRIQEIINDCFWNTTSGIDWFNLLGAKNPTALILAINSVILSTEGVTAIESSEFIELKNSREFTISYNLQTVYGRIELLIPSISGLSGS